MRALRALVLAALIIPGALLTTAAIQDWRQLHVAADQRARNTASILREHALKVFETHELILDRLDERTQGMTWIEIAQSEELNRYMGSIAERHDHVSSLILIAPDGQVANITGQYPVAPPVHVSSRSFFLVAQSSQDTSTYIGRPIRGSLDGTPIINISRRKVGAAGEFNGVVATAVLLDYFNHFYRSLSEQGADSVTVARADGIVLVRVPPTITGVENLSSQSGLMRSAARASTGVYETISELDQVRRLHAYEKVGPYPIYVSYGVSLSAVRQDWLRNTLMYGLFAALASAGLATVTWIALRQAYGQQAAVERWRSEANERERTERLYRALYNKAPVPQQSLDVQGIVQNVSDTWLDLLGFERNEVIGRHFLEFLPKDQHAVFTEHRAHLIKTGRMKDVPLDVLHRSGVRVPVLWSGAIERDPQGQFVKSLGTLVDVTERRKAEKSLAHLQKMEAIGQLVAGVGHDFNNLLQALSGCLQMIDKRISEPRLKTILETGQQAIDRGAKLTQQLMGFARKEALQPEAVDVPDQILGMSELLARALRANIQLELKFEKGLWPVLVDPTQFEVAILNLAVNARDAMPDGGTLHIQGASRTFAPGERGDELSGEFVCVSISDTGTGMPPEVLERVFDPFFTTKEVGKGTGLGLSQVYGFARQSGGTVEIESMPGQGTSVHLLLPPSSEKPISASRAGRTHGTLEGIRVLLVEDDPIVGTMVGAALEDLGCQVTRAATGEEALEALRSNLQVELLFSDIVMPGAINGVELAREARAMHPELGIVLTTGYSEDRARIEGVRVIGKPYRMETLAEALKTELAK